MGYIDAIVVCMYREDTSGRRLFTFYGRRYFVVAPGQEYRLKRAMIAWQLAIIPAGILALWAARWVWPLLVLPIFWIFAYYAAMAWVVYPMEKARDPELKPFPYTARLDAHARALGRPFLWVFAFSLVLMTLLSLIIAAVLDGGLRLVYIAAALPSALGAAQTLAQLWRTRRDP